MIPPFPVPPKAPHEQPWLVPVWSQDLTDAAATWAGQVTEALRAARHAGQARAAYAALVDLATLLLDNLDSSTNPDDASGLAYLPLCGTLPRLLHYAHDQVPREASEKNRARFERECIVAHVGAQLAQADARASEAARIVDKFRAEGGAD